MSGTEYIPTLFLEKALSERDVKALTDYVMKMVDLSQCEFKSYGYGIIDKDGEAQDNADTCKQYMDELADYLNEVKDPLNGGSPPYKVVEIYYKTPK